MLVVSQFLVLALATYAYGAAINCHLDRLAACGDPLSDFRKQMGQSFPTNEDQVKTLCQKMEEGKNCAEEYQNKCMTPMQLQTMGFLTEGSHQVYKEFCKAGSELRTDYLKNAECINDATKTDEAKGYYTYVEAALEQLSDKKISERLPTVCCGYQWLTDKFTKMGTEKCGAEAMNSFNKVVEMAVSNLPDVMCSGFDPAHKQCTTVLPPAGSKPKGTIKDSHIAHTFTNMYLQD